MHGSYNWTVKSLLIKHPSRPFNPNIANVFYLAGFMIKQCFIVIPPYLN